MTQISVSKVRELISEVRKVDTQWTNSYAASFYNSREDYWVEVYAKKLEEAWKRLEDYVSDTDGEPLGG